MASQSDYMRARRNYMERARYQSKRGYSDYTNVYIPTEKELHREGYTEEEIEALTDRLQSELRRNQNYQQTREPNGGEIIVDNLYAMLSGETGERDFSGSSDWIKKKYARQAEAKMATESAKQWLLDILDEEVYARGKNEVGIAFQENAKDEDIDLMLYGYDEGMVTRGMIGLAEAIRSRPLTRIEQQELSTDLEDLEDWVEY